MVSHPNVAFSVGILAQFMKNLGQIHWKALKWIITYLKTMKNLWLMVGRKDSGMMQGYCDADWASQAHWHLISGYSFHLGKGAVTWSLKKQHIVTLFSTEAEYMGQNHAA